MKKNYSFEEVEKLIRLGENYQASLKWYEEGNHKKFGDYLGQFVLRKNIESMERIKEEMKRHSQFFSETKIIHLDEIIGDLELFSEEHAQSQSSHEEDMAYTPFIDKEGVPHY